MELIMQSDGRCDLCQSYPPCVCGQYEERTEELDKIMEGLPDYCEKCHSKQILIDLAMDEIRKLKTVIEDLVDSQDGFSLVQKQRKWRSAVDKARILLNA